MYRKGSRTERELMDIFAGAGWAVARVAGSGVGKHPCPDVIVGNGERVYAIECKASKGEVVYVGQEQVLGLHEFSRKFGAKSMLGLRFNNEKWRFLELGELERTSGNNYRATRKLAAERGRTVETLIGKQEQ